MSAEEVTQAFATLRRHLPASLRQAEADLEAAWHNGGPLPVDWPDRFRDAAEVARTYGWGMFPDALDRLARNGTPEEVEAIGRALLGEDR